MTKPVDDTIRTPNNGTLTALRALATKPLLPSFADALRVTNAQAQLLRGLLPTPARLNDLFPSILVEYVDAIPVPGIAFWAESRWHIHIRASDSTRIRESTTLHELKHIIDNPLRRERSSMLSDIDWEVLANHFARRVLTRVRGPVTIPGKEELL